MKKITIISMIALFVQFLFFSFSVSAQTPEDYYLSREKQRQQYAASMERAHQTASSTLPDSLKKQFENAGTVAGSAMGASAEVSIPKNPKTLAKAAAQVAKRYGKTLGTGLVGGVLGQLAVDGLLAAIDYLEKDGSVVRKTDNPNTKYLYSYKGGYTSSIDDAGQEVCDRLVSAYSWVSGTVVSTSPGDYSGTVVCSFVKNQGDSPVTGTFGITQISNKDYRPDLPSSPYVPVTQPEFESKLSDYVNKNPNSDVTNQVMSSAYDQTPLDDNSSLSSQIGDAVDRSIKDATHTGSNSTTLDDGTTISSKFSDGTQASTDTSDQSTSTTKNPDGTTSTTTTNTTTTGSFNLPSFCDWASIVCDWYKWTKDTYKEFTKEPDLPSGKGVDVKQDDQVNFKPQEVKFGAQCPFQDVSEVNVPLGVGALTFNKDLTFMCTFGSQAKPIVLLVGYLGSLIYVLYALRNNSV